MGLLNIKDWWFLIQNHPASGFQILRNAMGILCLILLFIFCSTLFAGSNSQISEYEVKAACLFNFAKFIDWPEESFADSTSPIIIGVLGDDPFGTDLEKTVAGKIVKNRPFVIQRPTWGPEIKTCHILYISDSEENRFNLILEYLQNSSVLTVSDVPGFTRIGGIINFYLEANKVKFEINTRNAEKAKLKISSLLLRVAQIIK